MMKALIARFRARYAPLERLLRAFLEPITTQCAAVLRSITPVLRHWSAVLRRDLPGYRSSSAEIGCLRKWTLPAAGYSPMPDPERLQQNFVPRGTIHAWFRFGLGRSGARRSRLRLRRPLAASWQPAAYSRLGPRLSPLACAGILSPVAPSEVADGRDPATGTGRCCAHR